MEYDDLLKEVVQILSEMIGDWETGYHGPIGSKTTLIKDLTFESIDIAQLGGVLEEHFQQEGLPFEKLLLRGGRYVDDLCIGQIVDFLYEHLRR
jgi:acyl carrier protein